MEKLDAQDAQRAGNDRYEGFVVDLIKAIADIVGFNVRLHIVAKLIYTASGSWIRRDVTILHLI